jgi:hypothetical protein
MTPKEKALALIKKFQSGYQTNEGFYYSFNNDLQDAKQCALICVDEILSANAVWYENSIPYNYWQRVKTEIEKL